jgi:hypothetical protein
MQARASRQLPVENFPYTSWQKIVWLITSALLMVVFSNLFALKYLDIYSTNYGYWTLHQKWNLLGNIDTGVDVLILGDSSCSQGVVPAILESGLHLSAINLCTTGDMGTLGDLWMLEEYIQRFGSPKVVLIVHTFDIWHREFNPVRLGQIPRPWNFWREHSFGESLMEPQHVRQEIFLEHYVPMYSQSRTVGNIIRSSVVGEHNFLLPQWEMSEDGFVSAHEPKPEVVIAGEQQQLEFVSQNQFQVSELNDKAIHMLAELADTHQFSLILVNAPVYVGLYSHPEYQAYYQALHSYLQGVADQSNHTHHVAGVRTFPTEQMQNPDHLILTGAEEYSHWLVEQLSQIGIP